jgi:hypothetical protein
MFYNPLKRKNNHCCPAMTSVRMVLCHPVPSDFYSCTAICKEVGEWPSAQFLCGISYDNVLWTPNKNVCFQR